MVEDEELIRYEGWSDIEDWGSELTCLSRHEHKERKRQGWERAQRSLSGVWTRKEFCQHMASEPSLEPGDLALGLDWLCSAGIAMLTIILSPPVFRDFPKPLSVQWLARRTHRTHQNCYIRSYHLFVMKGYRLKSTMQKYTEQGPGQTRNKLLLVLVYGGANSPSNAMWQHTWNIANQGRYWALGSRELTECWSHRFGWL